MCGGERVLISAEYVFSAGRGTPWFFGGRQLWLRRRSGEEAMNFHPNAIFPSPRYTHKFDIAQAGLAVPAPL